MKHLSRGRLFAGLLLIAGAAAVAAVGQDQNTQAPGQPTRAQVWIQNDGPAEAVPVALQPMPADAPPLRVQAEPGSVFQTTTLRQLWEYRGITLTSAQDVAVLLGEAGADGWEATGAAIPTQNGVVVVMKRPH